MSGEHRQWKKIRGIVFLLSKSSGFVSCQFRRGDQEKLEERMRVVIKEWSIEQKAPDGDVR